MVSGLGRVLRGLRRRQESVGDPRGTQQAKATAEESIGRRRRRHAGSKMRGSDLAAGPSRVTFEPTGEQKFTFTVPTRAVELVTEEENAGEG